MSSSQGEETPGMYDLTLEDLGSEYECLHSDEKMHPIFRPDERITMFIAGCQSCGKSYYISQFLRKYRALHPERPVFLVTGLSEKDKHFEGFDLWKINLSHVPTLTLEDLWRRDQEHTGQGAL